MTIKLNDLSAMLDEHFRLAPPLDAPTVPVSGEVSEFGDGVSLGDGTSMAGVHGLENIQVVEKANSFDKVRQISMKDWLQKTIKENPNPEAVATSVQNLLKNGQISYFEQGREFASQLRLDPETKKLDTAIIAIDERPPVKPTLSFKQKLFRLFGAFKGEEAEKYNRDLLSYELQKKSLATTKIRVEISEVKTPKYDDGKGRIVTGICMNQEVATNVDNRIERSFLPAVEHNILTDENRKEEEGLQINPMLLDTDRFFDLMYPNGKPAGINTIQGHIDARVAKQNSFVDVQVVTSPKCRSMALAAPSPLILNALISVMTANAENFDSAVFSSLPNTNAYKSLFKDRYALDEQLSTHKLFDQFAKNLERYPVKGINAQAIENLLEVCIEPHPKLQAAIEAAKNPDLLKSANDKQPEKQMGKEAPKMKPNVPKMG